MAWGNGYRLEEGERNGLLGRVSNVPIPCVRWWNFTQYIEYK